MKQIYEQFFKQADTIHTFVKLFDQLPGVHFFVKDLESRMVSVSQSICERFGCTEEEIIGKTDDEFFPPHVAQEFVKDDQWVFRTGEPLLQRVEIWYAEEQMLDWFVTNKYPVMNHVGDVIGLMGTVQDYEKRNQNLTAYSSVRTIVDVISENIGTVLSVEDLAQRVGISSRQLNRRFQTSIGMSVQEFMMKTRIRAASQALMTSEDTISGIAISNGFYDQSAFTRQFRKHTGLTPMQFRKKFATAG